MPRFEAAEHAGHQQRLEPFGGVLRQQRGGVGHGRAKAQAGEESQDHQLFEVGAEGRQQAEAAEDEGGYHQHALAAEAVGQRPGAEGAKDHAAQGGAHHRAQAGARHPPVHRQRRRDEAHGGGIQAVEEDDEKAQGDDAPLIGREGLAIDELLDVQGAGHGRRGAAGQGHGGPIESLGHGGLLMLLLSAYCATAPTLSPTTRD
ncbi:hypothetical protein Q3H58_002425 [Pseudomonas psychrotolerans]|nr:hypothetical protein [Pseudomonas psychrotolerans]